MKISIITYLKLFLIFFVAGASASCIIFTNEPLQLVSALGQLLAKSVWGYIPGAHDHIVYLDGEPYFSKELISVWSGSHPTEWRQIIVLLIIGSVGGCVLGALSLWLMHTLAQGDTSTRHLRGRYISTPGLISADAKRRYGKGQMRLGKIRWPEWQEAEGLLLAGSTGSGKTTAVLACLDIAAKRGDQVFVTDQNGALMSHYMRTDNVLLLNPFDTRSQSWSILAEMRSTYDAARLSKCAIPDAKGPEAQQWTMYSQQLLAAVLERLFLLGHATNADLLRYFRAEAQSDLRALLAGKTVSTIFLPGNERLASNVQAVLSMYLSSYEYLDPAAGAESFSITQWIKEDGGGWLWITYADDQADALKPLIGAWLDLASSAVTSLPAVKRNPPAWQFWRMRKTPRRIWAVLDEAKSIGKVQSLEDSITKGRKAGLRTVIGIQSISQLRELYGDDRATTILGSLKSSVIFNTEDPDTAEYLSRRIGDEEVEITSTSRSDGGNTLGNSHVGHNTQRTVRRVVLASEIAGLPNLSGYVVLSGISGVTKVKFALRKFEAHTRAFVPKPMCVAPSITVAKDTLDVPNPPSPQGPEFI